MRRATQVQDGMHNSIAMASWCQLVNKWAKTCCNDPQLLPTAEAQSKHCDLSHRPVSLAQCTQQELCAGWTGRDTCYMQFIQQA